MRLNWRLSSDDLDAALLLGLPHRSRPPTSPCRSRLWPPKPPNGPRPTCAAIRPTPLLLRRRLFRAVYCDWPDLSHVLRLLAAHHARLFFGHDDPTVEQTLRRSCARGPDAWSVAGSSAVGSKKWPAAPTPGSMPRPSRDLTSTHGPVMTAIPESPLEFGADSAEDHLVAARQTWRASAGGSDVDDKLSPKAGRFDLDSRMRVF